MRAPGGSATGGDSTPIAGTLNCTDGGCEQGPPGDGQWNGRAPGCYRAATICSSSSRSQRVSSSGFSVSGERLGPSETLSDFPSVGFAIRRSGVRSPRGPPTTCSDSAAVLLPLLAGFATTALPNGPSKHPAALTAAAGAKSARRSAISGLPFGSHLP